MFDIKIIDDIDEYMDRLADDFFNDTQQNIVEMGAVNLGNLLKSGNIERNYLKKRVYYDAPYDLYVEYGRLPGKMPPVDKIKEWVLQKGLATNKKEITEIAWRISSSIKKNGIKSRPFFRKAIANIENLTNK